MHLGRWRNCTGKNWVRGKAASSCVCFLILQPGLSPFFSCTLGLYYVHMFFPLLRVYPHACSLANSYISYRSFSLVRKALLDLNLLNYVHLNYVLLCYSVSWSPFPLSHLGPFVILLLSVCFLPWHLCFKPDCHHCEGEDNSRFR